MTKLNDISLVAFDMFGTLVRNEMVEWSATVAAIAEEQGLGIDGAVLWTEWRSREVQFRKTRTNMADPDASPPFRTYWEAWRDAFAAAFAALDVAGDPEGAATRCIEDHTRRPAFPDALAALARLRERYETAVLSNADDRFLFGTIEHNGWQFETVLSSEALKAYKPDPRIFAALCDRTGVRPENILYVGDSAYDDVHGAKLSGMKAVFVRRRPSQTFGLANGQQGPARGDVAPLGQTPAPTDVELLPPDFVVESLEELPKLLA